MLLVSSMAHNNNAAPTGETMLPQISGEDLSALFNILVDEHGNATPYAATAFHHHTNFAQQHAAAAAAAAQMQNSHMQLHTHSLPLVHHHQGVQQLPQLPACSLPMLQTNFSQSTGFKLPELNDVYSRLQMPMASLHSQSHGFKMDLEPLLPQFDRDSFEIARPALLSAGAVAPRKTTKRNSKPCSMDGCVRMARSKGLCKAHATNTKCSFAGCTRQSQGSNLCVKHGGGRRCEIDGCTKAAQSKRRCKAHGGGPRCTFPGCTKSSQGNGRCRTHGGGPRCQVAGCNKGVQRLGRCASHGNSKANKARDDSNSISSSPVSPCSSTDSVSSE